jgi:hypothetical protein
LSYTRVRDISAVRSDVVSAESEVRRDGEVAQAILRLVDDAPDGLAIRDVLDELTAPGPSEEKTVRRASMELAKAGWLEKAAGIWRITDAGRSALDAFPEPIALWEGAIGRRDPRVAPATPPEVVGDIFAGCFLSIGGSLVGAVIGTIVLFVRMLPDPSLSLVVGFAAASVVGFVLSFLANFGIAGIASRFGRHAENIWVAGTALVAAVSGALTPSLLIAVDTAG